MRGLTRLAGLSFLLVVAGCGRLAGTDTANPVSGSLGADPSLAIPSGAGRPHHEFASLPDRGELATYQPALTHRDGAYTWHRADLSEEHALHAIADGYLHVRTPGGERLDVQFDRAIEHPSGDWTWVGHIAGHDDQQTILTFGERAAFGTIGQPEGQPLRLTVRDGASWMVETDPSQLAGLHRGAPRGHTDFLVVPPKPAGTVGAQAEGAQAQASTPVAATTAVSTKTVDIVLGYTTGLATALGGTSAVVTRLNYLVDVANVTYGNSQVAAKARLVATVAVNYPDATDNDSTLEKLTGYSTASNAKTTPDPAFNALRSAREQYGADMVGLVRSFREPENGGCGLAWLIGGGRQPIDQSDSYFAYSVIGDGRDAGTDGHTYYCLDETLTHELGHGMGAAHDVETAKGDNGVLDSNEYGAFYYSFGYIGTTPVTSGPSGFYTVMAYGDSSSQKIYRTFSNPRTTFCGSHACGTANADNSQTLAQTIPIVANFRATVVPEAPTVPPRLVLKDLDTNGDGRFDLLLRSYASEWSAIWFMSGTSRIGSNGFHLGRAYVLAATGDLNGDRRTDLVWTSPARDVVISMSSGVGYTTTMTPYTYDANTRIVGAASITGGNADILLRNAAAGKLYVWYMDGTTRVSYNAHAVDGSYELVGSGDLNGDGKQDLVWTSSRRDLLLSISTGWNFNTTLQGQVYSSDYEVVGVADVNGNGTADLVFRSTSLGRVVTWFMNGSLRVASSSKPMPLQYRLVGKGDFNADRRGDLVWTDAAGHIVMSLSTGSNFTDSVLSYTYTSDYVLMGAG